MSRGNNRERSCIVEFDGASSGNPGRSGAGAVIRSADGSRVHGVSQGLGTQTNNSAEYNGLLLGLKEASNQGYEHIHVRGDSQLVCNQFEGSWKVNNPNLRNLCNEAVELKSNFKSVRVEHVPRVLGISAQCGSTRSMQLGIKEKVLTLQLILKQIAAKILEPAKLNITTDHVTDSTVKNYWQLCYLSCLG